MGVSLSLFYWEFQEQPYEERFRFNVLDLILLIITIIGQDEPDHSQQNVNRSPHRNLQVFKQKIAAARKGHELLKRKADALKKKFKEVMKALLESKKSMGDQCREAFFLMAEAKYAAG